MSTHFVIYAADYEDFDILGVCDSLEVGNLYFKNLTDLNNRRKEFLDLCCSFKYKTVLPIGPELLNRPSFHNLTEKQITLEMRENRRAIDSENEKRNEKYLLEHRKAWDLRAKELQEYKQTLDFSEEEKKDPYCGTILIQEVPTFE